MRFKKLTIGEKKFTSQKEIESILGDKGFDWLVDYSEFENAEVEIKNETLIWHSGDFISGKWHYGIFKSGNFYGTFENGIFEKGNFKGKFISGIKK